MTTPTRSPRHGASRDGSAATRGGAEPLPPPTRSRLTRRGYVVLGAVGALLSVGLVWAVAPTGDDPMPVRATAGVVPKAVVVETLQGHATYYGPGLEGGVTASGDPFDPGAIAAAHPTLPFGTEVRVTGPDGRSVRAEVNDRLPDAGPSRIDLTTAAFERIAPLEAGRVPVTIEVLAPSSTARK